jgi:hypothetical protein
MNIVPAPIQEQINRVDRNRSLAIGISAGVAALFAIYRVLWLLYAAATLSGYGISGVSLVFPLVLWGAFAVVTGFVSVAFLLHYRKQP